MNTEMDDPDVYHQDFTTASSWEEFVDRVEKIIIEWKLNQPKTRPPCKKGDLEGEWDTKTEEINFEGKFPLNDYVSFLRNAFLYFYKVVMRQGKNDKVMYPSFSL